MNALAQNVTKLSKDYEALKKKCRQQQAEIEALKDLTIVMQIELDYLRDKAQEKWYGLEMSATALTELEQLMEMENE